LRIPRAVLLWAAAVRFALGVLAVLLAGFLYREHFVLLVLLRPTKEVLLAGGFFVREGDVNVLELLVASVPINIVGVWLFYLLGALYRDEIRNAELPGLAGRLLPPDRIEHIGKALRKRGSLVVFAGRMAAFPSTLLAAAAATSNVSFGRFVVADTLGAFTSMIGMISAGYVLGEAYERAGVWLTVLGVVVLLAMITVVGRALHRVGT
jgi:membrane-associated protein